MDRQSLIVQTKLKPPRPQKHVLRRERLTHLLLESALYRLTFVQAGTGYGKSTALAALVGEAYPLAWYHLTAEDTDPLVFLFHLYHGLRLAMLRLSEAPLALLEEWERNRAWTGLVDALVNALAAALDGPSLLILDDAHQLSKSSETLRLLDRFIGRAPADLHVILATRYPLSLPTLVTWRVRGQVLEVSQDELAFTQDEIEALFREQYGASLTLDQVQWLAQRVEGWPMALPLVWQRILRDRRTTLQEALGQVAGSAGELFTYLAQEVLEQQPPDIQRFLHLTSVLRQMTAEACDELRDADDSAQILRYLHDNSLFIVDLGDGHSRYHHLFHDLLYQKLTADEALRTHLMAATYCRRHGQLDEAVYHYLSARAYKEAAVALNEIGRQMIRAGRLEALEGWVGSLPPGVLADHPPLLAYLGDIARLQSRFEEALGWYQQAEERSRALGDEVGVGQALRGQARVYLDTVNPARAERLLQEALRLSDGQEGRVSRARLLELLAENLLNQGRFKEAERYQSEAQTLRQEGPGEAELPVRLLLRTGQLEEARRILEQQVELEQQEPVLRPRAHRETLLLLSLVLAFQGEHEAAYDTAVLGTERGRALHSPFVTAVGYMRQGHAWMLAKDAAGYEQARLCFEEAIQMSETLDVPRLRVEAYWGLGQAYGFRGQLDMSRLAVEQGIKIARPAGDMWIEAGLRLVFGAALVLAGRSSEAAEWLTQAASSFHECGDTYGDTVARLWQCLLWQRTDDEARLSRDVGDLLRQVRQHGYAFLFERKTLLGPPDPRSLVPLLLFARHAGQGRSYAGQLLGQLGLPRLTLHPGYQLRVQTLGPFVAWRGSETIGRQEWARRKALQLFQLLLTFRRKMLERDQITELLWPELDPETALRDFKIALTTLLGVLEPDRGRRRSSAYIDRHGTLYGLRQEADLWLDVEAFEHLVAEGDQLFERDVEAAIPFYRQALELYQGEFLEEHPYEEWCSEERERLHSHYLHAADRLARTLVARGSWDEALVICQAILAYDDCWEQAYRLMMIAYEGLDSRPQALRTYQRCLERLEAQLGVGPTAATVELYRSILGDADRTPSE